MKKKLVSILLVLILLMSLSCSAFAAYDDVTGHWAQEEIERWSSAGVVAGYPAGRDGTPAAFKPDQNLTRGEMAVALSEVLGWQDMSTNIFNDLTYNADSSAYFSDIPIYWAILKAHAAGVMRGDDNYNVKPYAEISRQDACVMLYRAFDMTDTVDKTNFSDDASISDYARNAVAAMSSRGYVTGFTDGSFKPNGNISRAQLCVILDRMVKDYPVLKERLEKGDAFTQYEDIFVASVPTYDGGYFEFDANGEVTTAATGSKDLIIRFWYPDNVAAGEKVPLMIWTHGGAWLSGTRASISEHFVEYLLDNGIAVASLEYRLSQEAAMPFMRYDIQAQIRYLRINADKLGIDRDNFGIAGQSAGGHMATLAAVTGNEQELKDPGYVTFDGDVLSTSTELQYCAWMYGCSNFFTCFDACDNRIHQYVEGFPACNDPGTGGAIISIFALASMKDYPYTDTNTGITYNSGPNLAMLNEIRLANDTSHELWPVVQNIIDASPEFWADKDDPPIFFYHGTNDPLCPITQAAEMFGVMNKAGVDNCVFRICEGMGHGAYHHPQYYTEMMEWCVTRAAENK